jgi:hypothetical protein
MRRVSVEEDSDEEQKEGRDLYIDEEPIRREGRDSAYKRLSLQKSTQPNQLVLAFHGVPDSSKVRWKTQTVDAFLIFLQEVDQF